MSNVVTQMISEWLLFSPHVSAPGVTQMLQLLSLNHQQVTIYPSSKPLKTPLISKSSSAAPAIKTDFAVKVKYVGQNWYWLWIVKLN